MSAFNEERVLSVHHWTDSLFTFTTTRDLSLRFVHDLVRYRTLGPDAPLANSARRCQG